MLRQTLFQNLSQHLLRRLGTGAGRAALEVGADLSVQLRPELPPLEIQETRSHVSAVHPAPYLA